MWGGLKGRAHYGHVFRQWSATKPVEELRQALFKEPRPWFIAHSLHEHRHHVSDHQGSRLLSWCTTVSQLAKTVEERRRAYQYSQEVFRILSNHHQVGEASILEYMRLCAAGKDLSAAYSVYQHFVLNLSRSSISGGSEGCDNRIPSFQRTSTIKLVYLAWLARIAMLSPSDDKAEDMVMGIIDLFVQKVGPLPCDSVLVKNAVEGNSLKECSVWLTLAPGEQEQLQYLCCCLVSLASRVEDKKLRATLKSIPICAREAKEYLQSHGWPSSAHHHSFSCLEGGKMFDTGHAIRNTKHDSSSSSSYPFHSFSILPRLKDSILHPTWIEQLESSAFICHNVQDVIRTLEGVQNLVQKEKECTENGTTPLHSVLRRQESVLWRQLRDPSAVLFREKMVKNGLHGITPELYHYLIVALAPSKPTAALRTLQRMQDAKLRVLDLTRAYLIIHVRDSPDDQARLFAEQLKEMDSRERLDEDHKMNAHLEAYWKYDYVTFFHYQNKLSRENFLFYLMKGLGVRAVQDLLVRHYFSSTKSDQAAPSREEVEKQVQVDLVVLDADLRHATYRYLSQTFGEVSVQTCLDEVTEVMPQLDISLIGVDIPHFEKYSLASSSAVTKKKRTVNDTVEEKFNSHQLLPVEKCEEAGKEEDFIATDLPSLRRLLAPYDHIYVVDASFVETGDAFLGLGKEQPLWLSDNSSSVVISAQQRPPRSLVLIPYLTLRQLADSAAQSSMFVSFDASLQQEIKQESSLALQRLHSLSSWICGHRMNNSISASFDLPTSSAHNSVVRVLHFTECFLSQLLPRCDLQSLKLDDDREENYQMLLIVSLLRTLAPLKARVILCSDDEQLNGTLEAVSACRPTSSISSSFVSATTRNPSVANSSTYDSYAVDTHSDDLAKALPPLLFHGKVDVLSAGKPPEVVEMVPEKGKEVSRSSVRDAWINDNPQLDVDLSHFHPVLRAPAWLPSGSPQLHRSSDPLDARHPDEEKEQKAFSAGDKRQDVQEEKRLPHPLGNEDANDVFSEKISSPAPPLHSLLSPPSNGCAPCSSDFASPWLRLLEEEEKEEERERLKMDRKTTLSLMLEKENLQTLETRKKDDMEASFSSSIPFKNSERMSASPLTSLVTATGLSCCSSAEDAEDSPSRRNEKCIVEQWEVPSGVETRERLKVEDPVNHSSVLWNLYTSPDDVVPVGASIQKASEVDTLYHEFGALEPDEKVARQLQKAAEKSPLTATTASDSSEKNRNEKGKGASKRWSVSLLKKEEIMQRGYSTRHRARLAKRLSNQSGGKVPFNLRYRVVEANINDPRNKKLVELYRRGVQRKREEFHRKKEL